LLLFSGFNRDFIVCIDFTISQLQRQQLMTSEIRSHTEYLIQTYNILVIILYSKLVKNLTPMTVLIRFNDDSR